MGAVLACFIYEGWIVGKSLPVHLRARYSCTRIHTLHIGRTVGPFSASFTFLRDMRTRKLQRCDVFCEACIFPSGGVEHLQHMSAIFGERCASFGDTLISCLRLSSAFEVCAL